MIELTASGLTRNVTVVPLYTITFNSRGGSAVAPITQAAGTTVRAPANPTREGYTFSEWHTSDDLGHTYYFNKMPTKNITVYAGWYINDGFLVVNVTPENISASIAVNGTTINPGYKYVLPPGTYHAVITAPGYVTQDFYPVIYPDQTTYYPITMVLVPNGSLIVNVSPANISAVIAVNNTTINPGDSLTLPQGSYDATVTAPGYVTQNFIADINTGQTTTVPITMVLVPPVYTYAAVITWPNSEMSIPAGSAPSAVVKVKNTSYRVVGSSTTREPVGAFLRVVYEAYSDKKIYLDETTYDFNYLPNEELEFNIPIATVPGDYPDTGVINITVRDSANILVQASTQTFYVGPWESTDVFAAEITWITDPLLIEAGYIASARCSVKNMSYRTDPAGNIPIKAAFQFEYQAYSDKKEYVSQMITVINLNENETKEYGIEIGTAFTDYPDDGVINVSVRNPSSGNLIQASSQTFTVTAPEETRNLQYTNESVTLISNGSSIPAYTGIYKVDITNQQTVTVTRTWVLIMEKNGTETPFVRSDPFTATILAGETIHLEVPSLGNVASSVGDGYFSHLWLKDEHYNLSPEVVASPGYIPPSHMFNQNDVVLKGGPGTGQAANYYIVTAVNSDETYTIYLAKQVVEGDTIIWWLGSWVGYSNWAGFESGATWVGTWDPSNQDQ
jgi:uncharacterized repeat protein (TIGR02543 family)